MGLEGEAKVRRGSVLLTRGAASTFGRADLAAIGKGHGSADLINATGFRPGFGESGNR
jgi:hypothetical protein